MSIARDVLFMVAVGLQQGKIKAPDIEMLYSDGPRRVTMLEMVMRALETLTQCAEFAGRSWATCTRGIEGCKCGMDDPHRVAMVLEQHNYWRREGDDKMIEPAAIGLALDAAVVMLRKMGDPARTQSPIDSDTGRGSGK